jgi:hypothetical protein
MDRMNDRRLPYQQSDVETWRRDGCVLIKNFFTAAEVAAVVADFERVFARPVAGPAEAQVRRKEGEAGRFHAAQFKTFEAIPFDCSPALNLIGVHPALIAFAREALECESLHLYQCQAWAKFTGDADYEQPFHCDFSNHTLTAPSEVAARNSVTILCYFTDVGEDHGPMHYVTRPDSAAVGGPETSLSADPTVQARLQAQLRPHERSSASPAGTIIPYAIDVFHRGTNLTARGGRRFAVMACFKKAGDDAIGYHAWAFHHMKPWARVFDHATPEQLACFGVPLPGHPFWTETTLARAQARYPNWNMAPYRTARRA